MQLQQILQIILNTSNYLAASMSVPAEQPENDCTQQDKDVLHCLCKCYHKQTVHVFGVYLKSQPEDSPQEPSILPDFWRE